MTDFEHICSESECIYLGQRVSRGMCGCYKSREQLMLAHIEKLTIAARRALNYIENTESELGIKLGSGDALRGAVGSAGKP